MYNPDYINWVQEGWRCPSCQKIWAPGTSGCPYCNSERRTFATTDVQLYDSSWWEKYLKQRQSTTVSSDDIEWWKGSTVDAEVILNNLKISTTSQKEGL